MCKWEPGNSPEERTIMEYDGKSFAVDNCIAPIVKALNDNNIKTIASCCGHGNCWGRISLVDGRELIIAPDFEGANAISTIQMKNIHGENK